MFPLWDCNQGYNYGRKKTGITLNCEHDLDLGNDKHLHIFIQFSQVSSCSMCSLGFHFTSFREKSKDSVSCTASYAQSSSNVFKAEVMHYFLPHHSPPQIYTVRSFPPWLCTRHSGTARLLCNYAKTAWYGISMNIIMGSGHGKGTDSNAKEIRCKIME